MSFDICMTLGELGYDAAAGERIFESLLEALPGADPVVGQNLDDGTLRIYLACDSESAMDAVAAATSMFERATGIRDIQVLSINVEQPLAA